MIYIKTQLRLILLVSIIILIGCQTHHKQENVSKDSTSELEAIIEKNIDSFYTTYKKYNYDWIDFFEDEFINVFPDTPIRRISKDSTKAIWKDIYSRFHVQIISYGKASFITSQDMVIAHNKFNEIFIHKQTQDTIKNIGTYITAWRRQHNDIWKIVFETVHNN